MNSITDRQATWYGGPLTEYDTLKVVADGKKHYEHDSKIYATKRALRRALSSEYGGCWIEMKEGKRRYFIDESSWLQRAIREVSKEEFVQKLEMTSVWQKVVGLGLGILALRPGLVEFASSVSNEASLGLLAIQHQRPLLSALVLFSLPITAKAHGDRVSSEYECVNYHKQPQYSSSCRWGIYRDLGSLLRRANPWHLWEKI